MDRILAIQRKDAKTPRRNTEKRSFAAWRLGDFASKKGWRAGRGMIVRGISLRTLLHGRETGHGSTESRPTVEDGGLLGGDAVEAGGGGRLKWFAEIIGAVGEGEGLQGSPDGFGEVVRGLDDDGDVGRAGDVESELIGPHAEAAVANYRPWAFVRQPRQAKNNTPGRLNKYKVSGSGIVVAVRSN